MFIGFETHVKQDSDITFELFAETLEKPVLAGKFSLVCIFNAHEEIRLQFFGVLTFGELSRTTEIDISPVIGSSFIVHDALDIVYTLFSIVLEVFNIIPVGIQEGSVLA